MRTHILIAGAFIAVSFTLAREQAPRPPQAPAVRLWRSPVYFPEGMEKYQSETHTQSIFVLNSRDTIRRVPILSLRRKWHMSGGMEEVDRETWTSEKFRLLPSPPRSRIGNISVLNSSGYFQNNRGVIRTYPDGTRFDDVLSNAAGEVFEHRSREKADGKWTSEVLYDKESARPEGYTGLKVSCASCHSEAGSGGYAVGLVPGSDTVLSDPVDWSLTRGYE